MLLAPLVELYRLAGRPKISDRRFSGEVPVIAAAEFVRAIRDQDKGLFEDILVDGEEVNEDEDFPSAGTTLEFDVRLPGGSAATFHDNLIDFAANAPQVSRGDLPDDFYLVEEDYHRGDRDVPEGVRTLETVCRLISSLERLAHYRGQKTEHGHLNLVFVQPVGEAPGHPVVIETYVNQDIILKGGRLDPELAVSLASADPAADPHYTERMGVFGVALAEFIKNKPAGIPEFSYLVEHWAEFVEAFHNNLGTYLSGFAFHKAKREVAEAEFEIAAQFSKVISDIGGKLFSIPVSLVAVAAIPKAGGVLASSIIVFGLLLAAVIVSGAVENQRRHFQRVKHAKDVVLGALKGKESEYPDDLKESIQKMASELNTNEKALGHWLLSFQIASWIPVWIAVLVHSFVYSDSFKNFLLGV